MAAIQMASLFMADQGFSGYVFNQTITADRYYYNIMFAAMSGGWNGTDPLQATVTINPGIVVSSTRTDEYAFETGDQFPSGSILTIINNGYILGMGGNAGMGEGMPGGPALFAQHALTVTNNGVIGGGGGGGGAGARYDSRHLAPTVTSFGGGLGGGGRSSRQPTMGMGPRGTFFGAGVGAAGRYTSDGLYGPGSSGGTGGDWGADGSAGQNSTAGGSGNDVLIEAAYAGGAGGAAVVGNANITWLVTGTRYGAIT